MAQRKKLPKTVNEAEAALKAIGFIDVSSPRRRHTKLLHPERGIRITLPTQGPSDLRGWMKNRVYKILGGDDSAGQRIGRKLTDDSDV